MAKNRYINIRFWIDNYISNLDPSEKLLFLYLLTNEHIDLSGIYEIPLKVAALQTGLDKEMVLKILERFTADGKIFYVDGWVFVRNFQKHQVKNPSIEQGIKRSLADVPENIRNRINILEQAAGRLVPDWPQAALPNLTLPNLTISKDIGAKAQSSKKLSWEKVQAHPLYQETIKKYPNRDYKYEFDLMVDWWASKRNVPPKAFSAFSNWLRISQPKDSQPIIQIPDSKLIESVESALKRGVKVDPELMAEYEKLKQKESSKS